jgi:hypothetical protein
MSSVNDHSSYSASESNSSESSSDEEAPALIKDDSNLVNDIYSPNHKQQMVPRPVIRWRITKIAFGTLSK